MCTKKISKIHKKNKWATARQSSPIGLPRNFRTSFFCSYCPIPGSLRRKKGKSRFFSSKNGSETVLGFTVRVGYTYFLRPLYLPRRPFIAQLEVLSTVFIFTVRDGQNSTLLLYVVFILLLIFLSAILYSGHNRCLHSENGNAIKLSNIITNICVDWSNAIQDTAEFTRGVTINRQYQWRRLRPYYSCSSTL
jgi:hypothetical protein